MTKEFPKYDPAKTVRRDPSSIPERRKAVEEEREKILARVAAEFESRRRSLEEMGR